MDVDEQGTEICFHGETQNLTKAKLNKAFEFIRSFVSDGEWHGRPEILEKGQAAGLKQHTLDLARKGMIESGELVDESRGRKAGVRLMVQRSDVPDIPIVSEQRQGDSEAGMTEQIALLTSEFDGEVVMETGAFTGTGADT